MLYCIYAGLILLQICGHLSIPITNVKSSRSAQPIADLFVFELPTYNGDTSILSSLTSSSEAGNSYGQQSGSAGQDVTRDSYGNIVTPYDKIPPTNPSDQQQQPNHGVGFLTDVNRDKTHHISPSASATEIRFAIPSYADGITQLQGKYDDKITFNPPSSSSSIDDNIKVPVQSLLPPLSSGNYNYPSLGSSNPSFIIPPSNPNPTISTISTDKIYQNEIAGNLPVQDESKLLFNDFSSQGNFLNPPKVPVNNFQSTQLPLSFSQSTVGFTNIFQKPSTTYNQIPVQVQTVGVTPADTGKYTGGFGGAPGLLGQQNPGILLPGKKPVASQIQQPALTGSFLTIGASTRPINSKPALPPISSNNVGHYTGGFGGPPGVLVPYDNLSSTVSKQKY